MLMSNATLIDMVMSKETLESTMPTLERKRAVSKTVLSSSLNTKPRNILIETQICKINMAELEGTPNKWLEKITPTGGTLTTKISTARIGINHGSVVKSIQRIQTTLSLADVKEDYGSVQSKIH